MIPEGYTPLADGTVIGKRGKPLKGQISHKGYRVVQLQTAGGAITTGIHTLICEAFHGARPSLRHQVRHLNGNKLDNRAQNLKWGTPEENWADKHAHGTATTGERCNLSRLTENQVREIRARYAAGGVSYSQLAVEYGTHFSNIGHIIQRRNWKHI
jgi:hypothetical protein